MNLKSRHITATGKRIQWERMTCERICNESPNATAALDALVPHGVCAIEAYDAVQRKFGISNAEIIAWINSPATP